jgi:SAM-dependent methyltransferase
MMQRAGLCVTAWDASAEMVALARRLHGIEAEQKTFDALECQQTFDGVWANFSLLHAPRQDFWRHLKAIHAALKNGGLLHLGLKTGTGTTRDTLGRLYTFFTPTELTDHLHSSGFTPIASRQGREVGLAGTEDPFIILRATR